MNGNILDLHVREWNHIEKKKKREHSKYIMYIHFYFVRWTFSFCVVCQRAAYIKWTILCIVCLCYTVTIKYVRYHNDWSFTGHMNSSSILLDSDKNKEKRNEQKNVLTLIWKFENIWLLSERRHQNWLKQTNKIDQF